MFIEIHFLQNFVPSVLNRDDLNNPKDTDFGDYRRARISSQCIKRAIRKHPEFAAATRVDNGFRTRWITNHIRERLQEQLVKTGKNDQEAEHEAEPLANEFAQAYTKKELVKDKQTGHMRTNVLVFISPDEVNEAVAGLLQGKKSPADIANEVAKKYEKLTSAPDIALFGRMLADRPNTKMEAACQVAHAISTNEVRKMETDFFTAVDDLQPEDTAGAGMMEYTDFNSACYYRYARIDWQQLIENLGWRDPKKAKGSKEVVERKNKDVIDLARRAVDGFLHAAFAAVPSGKKNSHAQFNPPALSLAVVREDGVGWNLANAFTNPVKPKGENDLIAASFAALEEEWTIYKNGIGDKTLRRVAALPLHRGLTLDTLAGHQVANLEEWVQSVLTGLPTE